MLYQSIFDIYRPELFSLSKDGILRFLHSKNVTKHTTLPKKIPFDFKRKCSLILQHEQIYRMIVVNEIS